MNNNELSIEVRKIIDKLASSDGKGKLKYTTNGKQKYIGNGKQKYTINGKQKYIGW